MNRMNSKVKVMVLCMNINTYILMNSINSRMKVIVFVNT